MRTKTIFTIFTIIFGYIVVAQMPRGPKISNGLENDTTVIPNIDFVKKYQLNGRTPTTMRLIEDSEMYAKPDGESLTTNVIIPMDSIVKVYKYFPKQQCWATQYHGQWGFVSGSKTFPVSRHTMNMNKYDIAPKLRSKVKQEYPKEAEERGITGTVSLKIYIDKNGKVTKTKIIKGISELNQAAIDAIKDAKFKPAVFKNKNIGIWYPISFDFE